jgi:glucose/arabinose dehydrogenase
MKLSSPLRKLLCVTAVLLATLFNSFADGNLPAVDLKVAWPNLSFTLPVALVEAPDGTHRMFLVEQEGRIWILPSDRNSAEPKLFLDISNRDPHDHGTLEEGLLSLAFHPQFKSNGKFYVFYTQQGPKRNRVSEIQVSKSNSDQADLATERVLLEVPKPYWNHNGSTLVFGPDGYLYFGTGDGGAGYDPHLNGQSLHTILGKILRIDVNSKTDSLPYGIPKDNPFVAKDKEGHPTDDPFVGGRQNGERPEIWAYGMRNPWRMSFDRQTGQLWVGDVGQDRWEEVDIITKGGNYGWSVREGFHPVDERAINKDQKANGKTIDPIIEYAHAEKYAADCKFPKHGFGTSITGGYVYRGKKIPGLEGVYVYADFTMGTAWGLRYENGQLTADAELIKGNPTRTIASFGEDSDGELYVLSFDGKIYQLVSAAK